MTEEKACTMHDVRGWVPASKPECVFQRVAIAGRVIDEQTNRPIAGAQVQITPVPERDAVAQRSDQTQTARDGSFYFMDTDIPAGEYELTASLPGAGTRYGTVVKIVTVSNDAQGKVIWTDTDLPLPLTTLHGEITSQKTKKPVAMAEVRVQGSAGCVFSDADGGYRLTGVEAGEVTLQVSAQGYKPASQKTQEFRPGEVHLENVELTISTGKTG